MTNPHGHAAQAHEVHSHGSGHAPGPVSWAMAATATLHCLTGCAIGEVLGMVIGTSAGLATWVTIALSVVDNAVVLSVPARWRPASPPPCSGSRSRVRWRSPSSSHCRSTAR